MELMEKFKMCDSYLKLVSLHLKSLEDVGDTLKLRKQKGTDADDFKTEHRKKGKQAKVGRKAGAKGPSERMSLPVMAESILPRAKLSEEQGMIGEGAATATNTDGEGMMRRVGAKKAIESQRGKSSSPAARCQTSYNDNPQQNFFLKKKTCPPSVIRYIPLTRAPNIKQRPRHCQARPRFQYYLFYGKRDRE